MDDRGCLWRRMAFVVRVVSMAWCCDLLLFDTHSPSWTATAVDDCVCVCCCVRVCVLGGLVSPIFVKTPMALVERYLLEDVTCTARAYLWPVVRPVLRPWLTWCDACAYARPVVRPASAFAAQRRLRFRVVCRVRACLAMRPNHVWFFGGPFLVCVGFGAPFSSAGAVQVFSGTQWTATTSLPAPRFGHTATLLQGGDAPMKAPCSAQTTDCCAF